MNKQLELPFDGGRVITERIPEQAKPEIRSALSEAMVEFLNPITEVKGESNDDE